MISRVHGRTFGGGWKPDAPDFRDWSAFDTDASAPRLAHGVWRFPSVTDFADLAVVTDQDATESCVAHAGCSAAELFALLRGIALPTLSRRAAYDWGRGGMPPYVDGGCFPRDAMGAWREWGFCSSERWPWSEAGINDPIPLDVIEAGTVAKLTGFYRVNDSGQARCDGVRYLLSEGYPVIFGQGCFQDLIDYRGGVLPDVPQGQRVGGHMTCVVGYAPGKLHVLNSWGTGWGERGFYWMSDARFGGDTVGDVYAFTCSPMVIR
jgi:hypothetical protein